MIGRLIEWSVANRLLVLLLTLLLAGSGLWAARATPVDALPDLSEVQVIIRTSYPGQAPQVVEDQVTYPLTSTMLSVPGAETVRGFSFFGDSFVYVIFEEGTELYWARSRVLEYLSQARERLPEGLQPALGPDATGVGWIYEYALVDRSGRHDLSQLRSLQDWVLAFELRSVPGVAEVASVGGMVRQYQVTLDPVRLAAYGITFAEAAQAIRSANQETGGSVLELAEAEYMVRAGGYLQTVEDFRAVPLTVGPPGAPITLGDIAHIQLGPEMRRGVAELDGDGEVAGGIIVLRSGANARTTIQEVERRLQAISESLPDGVEVVTTYNRADLIDRAVENLRDKLLEEFLVVALVCGAFLWHLRSSFVAIVALPLGVLVALLAMRQQGVNANIMSLGGLAIAVGAMVDAAVVMIENAHKRLEQWQHDHPAQRLGGAARWRVITDAAVEVGPALFFSLMIITLSFIPVFTLEGQEGRLFRPLALTKTYAMAGAAVLSVTLVPVLMGYWIRGRLPKENQNPLNRWLTALYRPALNWTLKRPVLAIAVAVLALASTAWPLSRLGGEFMPMMDEGDLLYMPSALPGMSADTAAQLLQRTDRLIMSVPEVESVFGKAGRAESATDPAPLEMFETVIRFRPRDEWRPGMTPQRLIEELDRAVQVPGLTNVWVPPIRNRIDMLATGIKSPIGIKVAGSNLADIERIATEIEAIARAVPGVSSAFAERLSGGRYIQVDIDRRAAARYGLSVTDIQAVVSGAIGGETIGEVIEERARYPISVRYPREIRDSLEDLRALAILTPAGQQITLDSVASIDIESGPPMLRSEDGRLSGWVYVDVRGRDLMSVVADLREGVGAGVTLSPGATVSYSGQFEYLERAVDRLKLVVPATIVIIFLLIYLIFRRFDEAALILVSLPLALIGGIWLLYALGFDQSVATGVGFIALAGVAAEFGVIMLLYIRHAVERQMQSGKVAAEIDIEGAIREGALQRVRPKAMTVAVILAGLAPIMIGQGAGSEVMSRIAAPMVGGMVSAPLLSMFIIPAAYLLMLRRRMSRAGFHEPELS